MSVNGNDNGHPIRYGQSTNTRVVFNKTRYDGLMSSSPLHILSTSNLDVSLVHCGFVECGTHSNTLHNYSINTLFEQNNSLR